MSDYPNPTDEDLHDPVFEAVWQAIKGWDLSRESNRMYAGASGNDVMHILKAIEDAGYGFICWADQDCPDSKPWSDE